MNDKRPSNQQSQPRQQAGAGLNLTDIYFMLFRHKWMILVLWTLGFIAAGVIYATRHAVYTSEATVMIRRIYNVTGTENPTDGHSQDVTGGPDGLIGSEMAILTSFDLALKVATNVGPKLILAEYGGGEDPNAAAMVLKNNLAVERMPKSSVLRVVLAHRDEKLVQRLLASVIDAYQDLHLKIHVQGDAWMKLDQQSQEYHAQLLDVEKQLEEKQKAAGATDIDSARKATSETAQQIKGQIIMAQSELESQQTMLAKLKGMSEPESPVTNKVQEIPREKLDRYSRNSELLDKLKKDWSTLRATYSEQSTLVKEKMAQIDAAEKLKEQMEKDEPRLAEQKPTLASTGVNASSSKADAIDREETEIAALRSRIKFLQLQANDVKTAINNLDALAPEIRDLQLKRDMLESTYKNSVVTTRNAKLDSDMEALRTASISPIQQPMPPTRETSKTAKLIGMAVGGGFALGLAWAFLIEFYIDRTVKRPKDIEGELGMRLFLSIPYLDKGRSKANPAGKPSGSGQNGSNGNGSALPVVNGDTKLEVAPWDPHHSIHCYNEALRDRLISYFETNNLHHKPKLVAVTGSSKGAGTSTIAAGIAASLSETGDGNVLLINMNMEHGSAQEFYHGKPSCDLDEALENETRDQAMIQDKLYVVNSRSSNDKLSRMLPRGFANLVPKLKASDYDYIIFDMPAIGRTGVTQRFAGFMDMTLLVVEAEKTNRDILRQTSALLAESKANVSVVLNKTRKYIPARLHQEF